MFLGMDTATARTTAENLRAHASTLAHARTRMTACLSDVSWNGDDANAMRTRVHSASELELRPLVALLEKAAATLAEEAHQQDDASTGLPPSRVCGPMGFGWERNGFGAPLRGPWDVTPLEDYRHEFSPGIHAIAWTLTTSPTFLIRFSTEPSANVDVFHEEPGSKLRKLDDLVEMTEEARHSHRAGADKGNVRIQKVINGDGEIAYIVHIPPTDGGFDNPGAWDGTQGNARDWANGLGAMFGIETTPIKDVKRAMEEADVPKGAKVLLTGHSQGAIVGGALIADPTFNGPGGYLVTDAFTWGGPTEWFTPSHSNSYITNMSHEVQIGPPTLTHMGALFGTGPTASTNIDDFGVIGGDLVSLLDFGGFPGKQVNNRDIDLEVPFDHEAYVRFNFRGVVNDASLSPMNILRSAHDTMGPDGSSSPYAGYHGSTLYNQEHNENLQDATKRLEGTFIGEEITVLEDTTVQFSRDDSNHGHEYF